MRVNPIRFDDVDDATQGGNAALSDQGADQGSDEWFDRLMRRPGLMLALLGLCTAAEWVTLTPFGQSWCPGYAASVAEWLHAPAMWLFLCWSVAVELRHGGNRLCWLWAVWMGGWGLFVGRVAWSDPALIRGGLTFNQMLVPTNWWATMGAPYAPGECYLALGVLALVLDICAGFPVTKFVLVLILCYVLRAVEAFD
ncbi:MAG TPA: hypothetical protein VHZ09_07785 [Acidobacteriaceae bacterium]|jgi:hypothetical protein|nr:hypothetical protein [Acidobacteriaceae bacterium]